MIIFLWSLEWTGGMAGKTWRPCCFLLMSTGKCEDIYVGEMRRYLRLLFCYYIILTVLVVNRRQIKSRGAVTEQFCFGVVEDVKQYDNNNNIQQNNTDPLKPCKDKAIDENI